MLIPPARVVGNSLAAPWRVNPDKLDIWISSLKMPPSTYIVPSSGVNPPDTASTAS